MLKKILIEKGFDTEFVEIFIDLLSSKITEPQDIPQKFLNLLKKLRVISIINNRLLIYDPIQSFSIWRNEIKWTNQNKNIEDSGNFFPSDKILTVEDIDEIEKHASKIYRSCKVPESIILAKDENQLTGLLCNSINHTNTNLRAIAIDTETINTSAVWGAIELQVKKGMEYSRICDLNEILLHGIQIKHRDIKLGVNLLVLGTNEIKEKFYVFDTKSIFIFETIDKTNFKNAGQLINSEYICQNFIKKFDIYMNKATKAEEIIDKLNNYYESAISQLKDSNLINCYRSIANYGVFSEMQKSGKDVLELHKKGFLVPQRRKNNRLYYLPKVKDYETKFKPTQN
jgi:hypothetical protein